jgi:hypothetical protein
MIPKSGSRFSEKIMRKQRAEGAVKAAKAVPDGGAAKLPLLAVWRH